MASKPYGNKWSRQGPEPEGKVRQSQVVSTFGPGSMVDLVNDAVLVGGLDFWRFDLRSRRVIVEPRLRDAIAKTFERSHRPLRRDGAFVEPPAGNDQSPAKGCGVEVLEFPQWFVCQNPSCRRLIKASTSLERKGDRYVHDCRGPAAKECVPVRFVMACKRGHLQDVPWAYFAHAKGPCTTPSMRLEEGATGDFSEVHVHCHCGVQRPLVEALRSEANPPCKGERPWLGREGDEPCEERLHLLVRTASNNYFSQVMSSISIPDGAGALRKRVEEQWAILQTANAATLPTFRSILTVGSALAGYPDAAVLEVIEAIKTNATLAQEPLRTAEYKQLLAQEVERPGEVPEPKVDFFARRAGSDVPLPKGVARLVLARKLREVRVQIGFTRLESATPDLQGEFDLGVQSAPLGLYSDWLPASEVRGEGFFLELDEDEVHRWETSPEVDARARQLGRAYRAWAQQRDNAPPFPGVRFYLLHSLAHLLISAVSLECGYPASAIRERIYCAPAGGNELPMAGILLSTGTPGTEGTLGGLVEQGRLLVKHLKLAFEMGSLCSNDPVCAAHDPAHDPTDRLLEGAACHGCLYLAEVSCERFNAYLDRALVVPTIGHENVAYFRQLP